MARSALPLALLAPLLSACALGAPVTVLPVDGGAVTLAAPEGHCFDMRSRRVQEGGNFVLLGSCAALSASDAAPPAPVVLTALVSPPLPPGTRTDAEALRAYFVSEAGRAGLSASGDAATVRLVETRVRGPVLYLRLRDRSALPDVALGGDVWRAVFGQGDRVVALGAKALAAQPVPMDATLSALTRFVRATRAANPPGS